MKANIFSYFIGFFALLIGCTSPANLPSTGQGVMQVKLVDAADLTDVKEVRVILSDLKIHQSSTAEFDGAGWIELELEDNAAFDLLTLQNGINKLLADQVLQAGNYQQLRLTVKEAVLTMKDGSTSPVTIPSGDIKINLNAVVAEGQTCVVTLDFDAAESLTQTNNNWKMAPPVVKIQSNTCTGT